MSFLSLTTAIFGIILILLRPKECDSSICFCLYRCDDSRNTACASHAKDRHVYVARMHMYGMVPIGYTAQHSNKQSTPERQTMEIVMGNRIEKGNKQEK